MKLCTFLKQTHFLYMFLIVQAFFVPFLRLSTAYSGNVRIWFKHVNAKTINERIKQTRKKLQFILHTQSNGHMRIYASDYQKWNFGHLKYWLYLMRMSMRLLKQKPFTFFLSSSFNCFRVIYFFCIYWFFGWKIQTIFMFNRRSISFYITSHTEPNQFSSIFNKGTQINMHIFKHIENCKFSLFTLSI